MSEQDEMLEALVRERDAAFWRGDKESQARIQQTIDRILDGR